MMYADGKPRIGNFTSSEIWKIMTKGKGQEMFGAPAKTYIKRKNWERRMGRLVESETWAKPTAWGKLLEDRSFDKLGASYKRTGSEMALQHPEYDFWYGSPDGQGFELDEAVIVPDVKCPWTLNSFLTFADCKDIQEVRDMHDDGEKYYFQLVSNACILGLSKSELVVYCPYDDELIEIRADGVNSDDISTAKWMEYADPREFPSLPKGGYYKDLYRFQFDVPQSDKDLLTARVIEASKLLITI
jgi:hypothetical protein